MINFYQASILRLEAHQLVLRHAPPHARGRILRGGECESVELPIIGDAPRIDRGGISIAFESGMTKVVCMDLHAGQCFHRPLQVLGRTKRPPELAVGMVSRKRAALENVLLPETVSVHKQRLQRAGFSHAAVWLRYFNFVSIVAIK